MFDLTIRTIAENHRRELLEEVERDRLAERARQYAERNRRPTSSPSGSIPDRLRMGFLAAVRRQLAAS